MCSLCTNGELYEQNNTRKPVRTLHYVFATEMLLQQDANSHGLPHRSCVIIIVLIVQDVGATSANTACKLHFPSM